MTKFCIVIPNYNDLNNLKQAIHSCLNQNFEDYRISVTDNNSHDGSAEYLHKLVETNPKIKFYLNSSTLSKTDNWNRAFTNAEDCEFLVNLHSDDYLSPNALKYINESVTKDTVLIHGANYQITPLDKIIKRRRFPFNYTHHGEAHKALVISNNSVGIVGTAFRQDVFNKIGGFSKEYTFLQDVNLWYLLSDYGKCKYNAKIFGSYRQKYKVDPKPFFLEILKWYQNIYKSESGYLSNIALKTLIYRINKTFNIIKSFNDESINKTISSIKYEAKNLSFFNPNIYHLFLKFKFINLNIK